MTNLGWTLLKMAVEVDPQCLMDSLEVSGGVVYLYCL